MLDKAAIRCPEAHFAVQDMCAFHLDEPVDLITCFLYSLHYSATVERLAACIARVHGALRPGGLFCFNTVDRTRIDNRLFAAHTVDVDEGRFTFSSGWHYSGAGERQSLRLRIEKTAGDETLIWNDEHPMVAVSFAELEALLQPHFELHVLAHDYQRILPIGLGAGNALFACVKR